MQVELPGAGSTAAAVVVSAISSCSGAGSSPEPGPGAPLVMVTVTPKIGVSGYRIAITTTVAIAPHESSIMGTTKNRQSQSNSLSLHQRRCLLDLVWLFPGSDGANVGASESGTDVKLSDQISIIWTCL